MRTAPMATAPLPTRATPSPWSPVATVTGSANGVRGGLQATVINLGTITGTTTDGIKGETGDLLTVDNSGAVSGGSSGIDAASLSLTNRSTGNISSTSGRAAVRIGGGASIIDNAGVITTAGTNGNAIGINAFGSQGTITVNNTGSITATGDGEPRHHRR